MSTRGERFGPLVGLQHPDGSAQAIAHALPLTGIAVLPGGHRRFEQEDGTLQLPTWYSCACRGTCSYLAPELAHWPLTHTVTQAVDVWSFGIMLVELATVQQPWADNGPEEIYARLQGMPMA